MAARVTAVIDRLVDRHAGGTVVVACHGGVIVQSMIRFLCLDPGVTAPRAWFSPENTSVTEFRRGAFPHAPDRGGLLDWELVRFNDHAHLAHDPGLLPS